MSCRPWLSILLVVMCFYVYGCQEEEETEPGPQDGWFNNLVHPDWGVIDSQLVRRSAPKYMDSVYEPAGQNRPNPFDLSDAAHNGDVGQGSGRGRTAMLVYFGQQIVEEIMDVQLPGCPREFFNIQVPPGHRYNPQNLRDLHMPFIRSRFDFRTGQSPNNPRQQLNELTPFLDGGLMYGPGKTWTDAIREFKYGWLQVQNNREMDVKKQFPIENSINLPFANPPPPKDHELKPVRRLFRLGNIRGFENPFLLTFGLIWFRYHNHVANNLRGIHPNWSDERLFLEAKKRVIAHHQKIVMYDWLPRWLQIDENSNMFSIPPYYRENYTDCGKYCDFSGYNPEIHPGISQEFQTSAMRFGHTLVTPGIWIRGPMASSGDCNWKSVSLNVRGQPDQAHAMRLCNTYFNGEETVQQDTMLDDIIRGLASTLSEREDNIIVPDLREHLFGPLEWSRRDLMAINIQRGRDHGVADYNSVREAFSLQRLDNWEDISNNSETESAALKVRDAYSRSGLNATSPDNLDLFVGGMLETTIDGPGPLFRGILLDQFLRIRHGDRFWFENTGSHRQFSDEEIEYIRSVTLRDIIINVTNVDPAEIQDDVFIHRGNNSDVCAQPFQLAADSEQEFNGVLVLENCTTLQHYDYFSGSELSFILTFLGLALCVPGTIAIMVCLKKCQERDDKTGHKTTKITPLDHNNVFQAKEWVGHKESKRSVKIEFHRAKMRLNVYDLRGALLRFISLKYTIYKPIEVHMARDHGGKVACIRVKGAIDLVISATTITNRDHLVDYLCTFLSELGIKTQRIECTENDIYTNAETKSERQINLDIFFRVVCLQAFQKIPDNMEDKKLSAADIAKVKSLELTRTEFAESLRLKPNSMFVKNMFRVFDSDKDGFIGFKEFLDMIIILSSGDAEEKARLIFNMYDVNRDRKISKTEFGQMIRSLLELSDSSLSTADLESLIQAMYKYVGLKASDAMTFNAFKKIFMSQDYEKTLQKASLGMGYFGEAGLPRPKTAFSRKNSLMERGMTFIDTFRTSTAQSGKVSVRRESLTSVATNQKTYPRSKIGQLWYEFTSYVDNYRLHIFWASMYIFAVIGIFVERAYYFSFEREHVGLRRIAGYGISVTRGAASVMMFTYSSLLVTMSRNTITFLRETIFNRFIPFDSAHAFHKMIAYIALLFTVMHCVGHSVNLYHINTQSSDDLNCFFREYFRASHILASFHYWTFQTITGMTGVILTLIVIVMFVFALPYARRHVYKAFWFTHSFYILLYIFLVMHGSGRLVQMPIFQSYFYGPLVLYVLDKIVSFSRNKVEIAVLSAELLPSGVTALTCKRPFNFEYKSGQWVRIACMELGENEYHPFTLTSAPHEDVLKIHIRAVGPWTNNIRNVYDPNRADANTFIPPKIYIDGPYGEGVQDWYKFPVAVLVGGGIGVTPFASILKDIVFRSSSTGNFSCKKVYFLWVTRNQKYFEWFTDIIRDVEEKDLNDLVCVHIFITQFQQKFDLRTTMLYICERHFQKIAGKSLFTGLKATTHFGRPAFNDFMESLHFQHPEADRIGVFSCGPPPMTRSVEEACTGINKKEGFPMYQHHYANF